jgi:hypothetical protein
VIPAALGLVLLVLVGLWLFGGLLLRIGGALLAFMSVAALAFTGSPDALLATAIGAALWLAGHWHYALRHHTYKSPLARYAFCRWAPTRLDPTRGWAVAVSEEAAGREKGERRPAG